LAVKSVRFAREFFSDQEKEEPGDSNPNDALRQANKRGEAGPASERRAREFFQAGAAHHAVIVFGDTFAAEELGAFRATRDSFAFGMI
jgi:hypothetical protein